MWQQQKSLAPLYEELRNIGIFDRVHDYAAEPDVLNERAHALRQARRKQILSEIARLRAAKPGASSPVRTTGIVGLICAVGNAMLRFTLR